MKTIPVKTLGKKYVDFGGMFSPAAATSRTRSTAEARGRVRSGDVQAALFMGPAPVDLVREVAAAGEVMPPKSTYFFPKVLTGMLFNPLGELA